MKNCIHSIYIYSITCSKCNAIKQDVIEYGLTHPNFYFMSIHKNDIPILDKDINLTIGAKTYSEVFILGTPTLLEIKNGMLLNNIAGSNAITYFINH